MPTQPQQAETERRQGVEDGFDGREPRLETVAYLAGYATGTRHASFLRSLYNEGHVS